VEYDLTFPAGINVMSCVVSHDPGIVIGVGAVITMVTSAGATLQVREQIASMGVTFSWLLRERDLTGQSSGTILFKEADGEAIIREVSSIALGSSFLRL